ncbi:hypothetical protein P4V86_23865 [Brevibacillus laterosporus]|uniref:hypothetical protein n=1 Tax=Brevibacillus laterosporus TaxID=1465 RepID=UPI00037C971E|nr:hypothetical protein [Brevibacillus laterosporus]MED2006358.1 hypothetical protein [Brevibacillus laterosporus]MED4764685.1 hypothetical protein [Brevibacillus laterosporus]
MKKRGEPNRLRPFDDVMNLLTFQMLPVQPQERLELLEMHTEWKGKLMLHNANAFAKEV